MEDWRSTSVEEAAYEPIKLWMPFRHHVTSERVEIAMVEKPLQEQRTERFDGKTD